MLATVKKWGNSIGLVIPAEVVRTEGLHPGDAVDIEVRKRIPTLEELGGTVRLKQDLQALLREMERGWNDL